MPMMRCFATDTGGDKSRFCGDLVIMGNAILRCFAVTASLAATVATLAESGREFKLDVVTDEVPSARQMALAPSGVLFAARALGTGRQR